MKLCQAVIVPLLLIFSVSLSICSAAVSVEFLAGSPAGWDFYELQGDIVRNNTVDWGDLSIIAQHWLGSSCGGANLWCSGADMDSSSGVDFVDYALLVEDWSKQAGENVLLQTIYGTAQDSAGNITANAYRALSIDKGMAMAFAVPGNTVLDKGIFKCWAAKASNNVRIRLFNVTGKGYLNYLHTMTKADPSAGSSALIDKTVTSPSSVPYHSELGDGRKYTDMVINFGLLEVTAGEYLMVFDGLGPDNTPITMVKGSQANAANMGLYPDGSTLPKRATVTTGSTAIGNTYYYQLETNTSTSYSAASNLFAFQMLTTVINHAPTVDAGTNQTVTYPDNDAVLDGTVGDDGLPVPPGVLTTLWTKQSGQGTVTFDNANTVDTTATFSDYGTYVLRLTANDSALSTYDEVTIDYTSGNQAPVADAGTNTTITYPVNSVNLDGTVSDDGKPVPPGVVTTLWTRQSGPGTVTFGDANAVDTAATFSDFGTYVLRLTANDGELSTYDVVTINYLESPAQNEAPVVNAGIDLQIALSGSAILDGTVTDDGLPNPPHTVTTLWTKQSGPGTVTFGNASSIDTTASFSATGTYVLRLTANDSALSSYDEVAITVNNETPVQTAELQWDGGLNHQMVGNEISNGRWEDANNWYCNDNASRNRTIPILGDTVKIHFYVTNDPANPNSPNFNPQSHITIDTVGIAKAGKVQAKEYTNSLTIQAGADLETRGNIEWYQDWDFNVHDLIIYGTVNAGTNTGQVRIGGHQSFSHNNVYVYGVLNILGSAAESALWLGYAVTDGTAAMDHNRLYIYSTGIVTTDDLYMKTGNDCLIDIQSGGKLVVKGNEKAEIDGYVSDGAIAGDGVVGNVTVTYFADSDETVVQPAGVPQVNAGGDVQIINPVNSVALNGTVIPDGLTTQWTKLSSPGTVVFEDAGQANTTATFSTYGTYVLHLEATQSSETGYDDVIITYLATQPAQNQAPVVNAGTDQQITLGSNATLDGTVSDDGLPNPPGAVTTTWTKQSGPGTVTFSNSGAVDTTASFSAAGTYVLRLTASDNVLTSYDEMTIVVEGGTPPIPPVTQWYRIALHFHTINSDGAEEPNMMFTRYRDMGPYDGACMTDHDYITDGSTWNSSSYLAINGVEISNGKSHVNAFGATETPGTLSNPGATLQEHITRAIAAGALPIVNHPKWTMEYTDQKVTDLPQQIINSTGCKLFEIFNHYCEDYWGWGFSETIYDQVLSAGKQMYCVAGDDAHGLGRAGFTSIYVGAEELTVDALKDALNNGYFYTCRSTTKWDSGIKLTDYQVDGDDAGDTISITADVNAQKIEFIGNSGAVLKTVNGTSGSYTILGTEKYVRARITNTSGDYTWTQPVFVSGGTPPGPVPIDDYEGYGAATTGGNGGTDILVTNLADSGAGSLRAALAQANGTSKFMIKFNVGGCITLATPLTAKSFVTIAGETAPSPGITLLDGGSYRALEIDCQNFIFRHIRMRNFTGEGIQIWGGHDNVIDRCSITGSGDGAIDMNTGGHFIISRCLFGGNVEVHKAHCTYVSAHHGLYAWNNRRQPRVFEGGPYWDFRNNYVEYWTNSGANILSSTAVNLVNNYWGPPSPEASWGTAIVISGTTDPNTVYTNGNYCAGFDFDAVGKATVPNLEPNVTTIPAVDVPANVLADCGAQPNDAIDQYYINGGGLNPPAVDCSGGGSSGGGGGLAWSETADYYVDGLSGSDSNPGTSAAPWQTLTNAVTNATSGKKVLVWGGQTYSGALTFNNSGTSASPITFKRDPASNSAIIDGAGTTTGTLYTTKAKYIVMDGFTIQNGKYGIYTYGSAVSDWTIKNCRVTNNSMYGLYIRSGTGFSLFNDAVYLNAATTTGIYFFNSATNNNVTQCSVYGQKYGITYDTSASGTVTNSIVANNTIYGVYNRSSTVTVTYSDVWGNGTNYSGCSAGPGCISADPKWTDPDAGDFHLGSGSPCDNTASDGGDMGYRYSASAL